MTTTRQWHLAAHPRGRPIADGDLLLETVEIGDPAPGEMLLKTRWLGFDPAQKGWMENVADYVAPMAIGEVMRGSGITEVIASNHGKFPVGRLLAGANICYMTATACTRSIRHCRPPRCFPFSEQPA
jgi:NADPH-dependent curcumin reductase CurA